jgi:2-oxo-3-hexenedioate decarboxylase
VALLTAVEWIAPGFEIVQSHFPDWKFTAPDCAAAFGLHAALVVGTPVAVSDANRTALADTLPMFAATLKRNNAVIDRGVGANVLGSPALALAHLARLVARQPQFPPLARGEIVTTGTLTDAWPVADGETWSSDYGALGLEGLTLSFINAPPECRSA